MSIKLGPAAQQRIATLEQFNPHVARLNSLVEQYAAARTHQEQYKASLKRAAAQLKLKFTGANIEQLAQVCGSIELAAARSGNAGQITRILRELVGSLKFQLELEIRTVIREDQEAAAKKLSAEEEQV